MNKLAILFLLLSGSAYGELVVLEYSADGSVFFEINQQKMVLNTDQVQSDVIQSFVGPCGQEACQVAANSPFALSYVVTGANRCFGTGGNLNWRIDHPHTNGLHTVNIVPLQNDATFTLNCIKASNSSTHSLAVNITTDNGGGGGGSCSTSVYPPTLTRKNGVYRDYNDGFDFGESTNASFMLDISNNQFYTLSGFSLLGNSNLNIRRKITLVDAPTQRQIDQSTMSISECPGDFTQSATCVIPISATLPNSLVKFSTLPSDDPNVYCILDPSKTYYVNFVNSPNPYTSLPSCRNGSHTACTIFYSEGVLPPP